MQHDLFVHPNRRLRSIYPLIAQLQSDVSEGRECIVAPLTPFSLMPAPESRLRPTIRHDGTDYAVVMRLMGAIPTTHLRRPVGSIAAWRDDISRALDWLFFGI